MKRLSEIIGSTMPEGYSSFLKLNRAWKECAGETISFLTTPGSFKDGVLNISVHDQTWLSEIGFLKGELTARLNTLGVEVSSINFFYKPRKNVQAGIDSARRKAMSEKEKKFADRLIATIENEELKNSFRKAIYAYFTRYTLDDFLNC